MEGYICQYPCFESEINTRFDICSFVIAGTHYLQQFCASAVNAVVSPFILYDLAMEAAHYLARNNPVHVSSQLRSNILNPLYQKCLQM